MPGNATFCLFALSAAFAGHEMKELPSCGVMAVYTAAHYYDLFSDWDGECLEISEAPFLNPFAGHGKIVWMFIAFCAMLVLFRSVTKRRLRNWFALCLLLSASGCDPPASPIPSITFDKLTFSAGTVPRGPDAKVRCRFVVGKEPVVITAIESRCGCMSPDDDLVGKELLPGTAHSFVVTLNTNSRFAETGGSLIVRTDPPGPEPLLCHVSAYIDNPPEPVGTLPIRVASTFGMESVTEVVLEHWRGHGQKPVEWDEQQSDLAGFSVSRKDFSEEPKSPAGGMVGTGFREFFRWTLRLPKNLSIGRHLLELRIAWKDDVYPAQMIPIEVSVSHPIRTSLDQVFFGVIKKGMPRRVDVRIVNWNASQMKAMQVDCDDPLVTAVLDRKSGTIQVRLSELAPSGRLQTSMHIRNGQQSPGLKTPVSAVISENQAPSLSGKDVSDQ